MRLIGNAYQQNMVYKTNVVMQMVGQWIGLFIQISVWFALYGGKELSASNMGSVSIDDMIYYVILSVGISMIVNNQVIGQMDEKIKSGMIAMDLIKPMNFHANILCHTLGNNLFRITFQALPLCIIGFLIFDMPLPSGIHSVLFIISLINAFLLNFILAYMLGMIGFWYLSVWHLSRLLEDVVRLFGGVWIPLWFFPKAMVTISEYLPFQYIYFVPINIYLNKLSMDRSFEMLLNQAVWIVLLSGFSYAIWRKGIQKLVIQGG
ncbi:ABC transporter permease [Paenibacillus eucommiae]|uniref:ABC-2 type transport system permease protein n=1 Tax=Paenibacillus eucommiae TaxID=1355755 RepID=A0ABS4J8D6_9BACL|nr:ABC-2 family transporter protein [Paenibacillus eucommiae]MBP1996113.1 ABC-2 type transport system permease protein [Paenibacillus eucommiae]